MPQQYWLESHHDCRVAAEQAHAPRDKAVAGMRPECALLQQAHVAAGMDCTAVPEDPTGVPAAEAADWGH